MQTKYEVTNKETGEVPFQMFKINIEPVYQAFDGWQTDITSIKTFEHLPAKMKVYINYLNQTLNIPVKFISNGPGSDQLIVAS